MEKITRDKLVVKIVCTALATILWFYVSYLENPSMSKTVKNVPVVITGGQALKEKDLAVYSNKETVDVKVTGKRMNIARLNNRNLKAMVNVSSINKSGTHLLPAVVEPDVNADATFYVKNRNIKFVIEPRTSSEFKIEANLTEIRDKSLILDDYELSTQKVTVSAPESVMKDIGYVKTEEFSPDKENPETTLRLVVYGKDGTQLEGAECNPSEVKVSCSFHTIKTVPIVLKATNGKTYSLPSENTVKIYGSGELFDSITQIETDEINLALFEKDSKVRIKLNPPEDIMIADNSNEIEIVLKSEFYE